MLVGGVMIFVAGILGSGISFGGLNYARTHVCIFGSVLSAIGSGSTVFGILLIRGRTNSNRPAIQPRPNEPKDTGRYFRTHTSNVVQRQQSRLFTFGYYS